MQLHSAFDTLVLEALWSCYLPSVGAFDTAESRLRGIGRTVESELDGAASRGQSSRESRLPSAYSHFLQINNIPGNGLQIWITLRILGRKTNDPRTSLMGRAGAVKWKQNRRQKFSWDYPFNTFNRRAAEQFVNKFLLNNECPVQNCCFYDYGS